MICNSHWTVLVRFGIKYLFESFTKGANSLGTTIQYNKSYSINFFSFLFLLSDLLLVRSPRYFVYGDLF